ncbi:MAG: HD domain-containing protein [Acidimicrobiia bacterium]|nr:HD domain-containing protein [Acidimicrobiia bacterium]
MKSGDIARVRAGSLSSFLELRKSLRRERIGDGGLATCHILSDALDAAIVDLASDIDDVAIVAVGGYGRREQCVFSDVDVMVLHGGGRVEHAVRDVLYPLWDANLKVGHSVRTPAECATAARENFETLTSLLSARLIAGDGSHLTKLEDTLRSQLTGRPLTGRLAEAERERRDTDPYPLMAADLKSGRGGLRTFQGFDWQRRRAELLGSEPFAISQEERLARQNLLSVRNALHAVAGKAMDEFVADLREPAARWLGLDVWDTASRVTSSLRTGDRLAAQRWPDLLADSSRKTISTRLRRRLERRAPATQQSRPLGVALAAAKRSEGVVFTELDQTTIRNAGQHDWSASDVADLTELVAAGERGRAAFGRLDTLGWVAANLQEVVPTIAAPQLAPFHEHPVDTHLWRTADEMSKLVDEGDDWYSAIAAEVGDRDFLLLAAWLHDIGKARPGDHSTVGADLVLSLADRIGLPEGDKLAKLVRLHLLLPETATKRDTNDPSVIAEVADRCGDLRTLQSLYLLSVADARATGRTMWNDWKATLLRNLYVRLAATLDPTVAGQTVAERTAAVAAAAEEPLERVTEHLDLLGREYLTSHTDDEICAHVILSLSDRRIAARVIDPESPAPRLALVASDAKGLLGAIAGVLAIHNLEILDARLHTRSDGLACDTLHLRQLLPTTDFPDVDDLLEDLDDALSGELDLAQEVAEKAATYATKRATDIVVRAPTDPTLRYTPVEVRCADRPGALYLIVQSLYAEGLDIKQARIDTRADEVRDLFYVLRNGERIRDVNELQPLIAQLRRTIRGNLGAG